MKIKSRKTAHALPVWSLILILLLLAGLTAGTSYAQSATQAPLSKNKLQSLFYQANEYYEKGQFQQAVDTYQQLMSSGYESGALYYNLGNAYFKLGQKGQAILHYEKARRLIPGDADLKANLTYATANPASAENAEAEKTDWKLDLMNTLAYLAPLNRLFTISSVGFFALIGFIIYLILFPSRVRTPENKLKGIWMGAILTIGVLFTISVSITALTLIEHSQRQAVAMQADVVALFEPKSDATLYYHLSEGDRVRIMEEKGDWLLVKRPDGKRGWVEKKTMGEI